jgi:hypothetical protein
MKEPRDGLKADTEERANAPDFDELVPPEELMWGHKDSD